MRECVIVGVGQLGRLFGAGALACGCRVTPVRRGDDVAPLVSSTPGAVLVTVGEGALADVLARVPKDRHGDVVLVQNELFPDAWRAHLTAEPTVAVVWSNVKRGRPVETGRATHVHGRHAPFVCELHGALDIPCAPLANDNELRRELVAKYAFIVAVNALGLEEPRTVGAWLDADPARVDDVLARCVTLGEARAGGPAPGAAGVAKQAMAALRAMPAAGRTARERVERARAVAAGLGIADPLAGR